MEDLKQNIFGLTERDVHTIREIFLKYPMVKKVYIFGSRAKGNSKTGSDIDLAIMDDNIDLKTILSIKGDFEESSLAYFVDLVHYPSLTNPEFRDHVDRVGILFFSREDRI